jgi:hypothetical protein
MANGTMIQLAASVNDVDTSDNLIMFEAFGKVVILNGANKKIADFKNSKIETAAVGTHPPDPNTLLTGGSSGAKMVVDYITALSGACTIYGWRTTTATFTSGETVTGTDDDGNAISFTMTAVDEVTYPHWYDFTPFGNSSTFGELPAKLYLGALYLGRLYAGGDPDDANHWFASRQGSIFDFKYVADDVQSPVDGGDVEVGKLQGIPRDYIPYGNDYMLFACHDGIYALIGDPKQGGTMKAVEGAPPIFGQRAWCFDEQGNLWYYGTGGVYKILAGLAGVEPMTEYRLPSIIHDEGADPSTHRITLAWDSKRHGLIIAIVKLSDGTNSCYWYERRTDGFFPEEYPEECAPYSLLYYQSSVTAQRDLLFGCTDGYIRQPDDSGTDDNIGATTEAVDSQITFGPFKLGEQAGEDGIIGGVSGILAENRDADCSNVSYYIYVADSPGAVIKKVEAGTHSLTGTVYAPGFQKGKKQRNTVRGKFAAIMLRNNTAGQTWAMEEIQVDITPAGRLS